MGLGLNLTVNDIDALETWWQKKSRMNFLAFRQFLRYGNFQHNWFIADLCKHLQSFYLELIQGMRPTLVIQTPPQHGKSWTITDFIAWVSGKQPNMRTIYASFSDKLGTRANLSLQRFMDTPKYKGIFEDCVIPKTGSRTHIRTNDMIEFIDNDGFFRNTTVGGPVTGESLDLGVIDDPIKGREQANSSTYREKIWEWFTDDFSTRFSESAGLLIIMTRWHVDDLVGRLLKDKPDCKVLNYPAIATHDELHRKKGEPLFPDLKSHEFLMGKKQLLSGSNFTSLYQGMPVVKGGDKFKDKYWKWWTRLPQLKYKFIVGDTAQKVKTHNDYTCFQCWGMGMDNNIYLLDMIHGKFEAPELRREAVIFYHKHNIKRKSIDDPVLRGMYIEDKSSGTGLIQELKRKRVKVFAVQRHIDKILRSEDAIPEIESGKVYLNENVSGVGVITSEARAFPNGEFDDAIDTVMTGVEVAFLNKAAVSSLLAAMEAD